MLRMAKHLMRGLTKKTDDTVDVSEIDGVRSLHLGSITIQSAMRIRDPFAASPKSGWNELCRVGKD